MIQSLMLRASATAVGRVEVSLVRLAGRAGWRARAARCSFFVGCDDCVGCAIIFPPSCLFALHMVHAGSRWFTLVHAGSRWFTLVHAGSRWFTLVHAGSRWFTLVHAGSRFGAVCLRLFAQEIARLAHRMQEARFAARLQLGAQVA